LIDSLAGRRAAAIACIEIETIKLNDAAPQAWIADTLACVPDYRINRVEYLLPWRVAP
jgi:hypothetical protein